MSDNMGVCTCCCTENCKEYQEISNIKMQGQGRRFDSGITRRKTFTGIYP